MKITFWGVRGSLPSPISGAEYREILVRALDAAGPLYKENPDLSGREILERLPDSMAKLVGGDTTCVLVETESARIVLDMGSGARKLGYEIASGSPGRIDILMTHTHWDHIQGWPFFVPAYIPGYEFHIHSTAEDIEERFLIQQKFEFFPISMEQMASGKHFHTIKPRKPFSLGKALITAAELPHPGGSAAYRIEENGKSMIFATDTEFHGKDAEKTLSHYDDLFSGADILILDSQYTTEEADQKAGWGHTSNIMAVDCAKRWGVRHLVLTHHEPAHTNEKIFSMLEDAAFYRKKVYPELSLEISIACEGDTITL